MIDCHKMKSTNGEPEMYQGYTEGIVPAPIATLAAESFGIFYGVWLNMNAWR